MLLYIPSHIPIVTLTCVSALTVPLMSTESGITLDAPGPVLNLKGVGQSGPVINLINADSLSNDIYGIW